MLFISHVLQVMSITIASVPLLISGGFQVAILRLMFAAYLSLLVSRCHAGG